MKMSQQSGFTLIESLVAAALLGVGLLALAGMQGISLGRNVNANELGRVTNVAADMVERIKFNQRNALFYNATGTGVGGCATIPATQPMARGDCAQWATLMTNSGLPNAVGSVSVVRLDPDPTVNPVTLNQFSVAVSVSWTGNNQTQTGGGVTKTVMFSAVLAPE